MNNETNNKKVRRPGYGIYKGYEYKVKCKGHYWAAFMNDDIMTGWHDTVKAACDEFRAGVDDLESDYTTVELLDR